VLVVDDGDGGIGAGGALDGDLTAGGQAQDGQGGHGAQQGASADGGGHGVLGEKGAGIRGGRGQLSGSSGREGSPRLSMRRLAQEKKAAAEIRSATSGSVRPRSRRRSTCW